MVLVAATVTFAVSLVAIIPGMFIAMLFPGILISISPQGIKGVIIFLVQLTSYTIADFTGVFVGYLILNRINKDYLLPVLFIPIFISSVIYSLKKQSFFTEEAQIKNAAQKAMSFSGFLFTIFLSLLIL